MEYHTLANGVIMPAAGYGTWDLRGRECIRAVEQALSLGCRLIDTAIMYGNETEVGQAVHNSHIDRSEIFLTTKINSPYASYAKTRKAVEESLQKMKLDYIDLILIHEPYPQYEEMYRALEEAYQEGKVRAIGVSNFSQSLFDKLWNTCSVRPMVNQVESHVYYPQLNYARYLHNKDVVMESWAPFTEGRRKIFREPILTEIAEECHKTAAQIALKYLVQNGITVIPKSAKKERIRENLDIFDFQLNDTQMAAIASLDEGRSLFGWYE